MANTVIKLKSSGVTGNVPNNLEPGELAINYVDGKLFYGNTSCNAILFDVNNPAGLEGELQFNNSGEFGSSANLKFDNTTKTLNVKNVFANGNVVTDTLTVVRTTNLGNVSNVTITGGSANQFLITDGLGNLSFGVGTMGAQGAAGAQGAVGAQGAQGAQGVVGAQGAQGVAGAQGVQGAVGQAAPWEVFTANTTAVSGQQLIANTYSGTFTITLPATPYIGNVVRITDGYDWSINNLVIARNGSTIEGTTSDVIVDVKGTTVEFVYDNVTWQVVSTIGPMGNTGPQGIQGTIGPQGFQGVAGAQGAVGAQGDVGAQGVQGAVGAQGVQGAVGAQGVQGAIGAQGVQGAVGAQGATGAQGAVGAQGVQGAVGAQGAQGPQGSTPTIGGSNTEIQFNNSGSLGGTANLIWNGTGLGVGTSSAVTRLSINTTTQNSEAATIGGIDYGGTKRGLSIRTFQSLGGDDCGVEFNAAPSNSGYGAFKFNAAASTLMYLDAVGNMGIGTTSPSGKLDVLRSSTSTAAFDESLIRAINSAAATLNQRVDIGMRFQDGTYNGIGGISMIRESATARSGALSFSSIGSDGNPTSAMRLDSLGNVGIGTTSPVSRLNISDGAAMYAASTGQMIQLRRTPSNGNNTTSFVGMSFGNGSNSFRIGYGGSTDRFRFIDGGEVEVLSLVNGGNVGIGETAPSQKLHFKGSSTTYALAETTGSGTSSGFRMKAGANTDYTLFTTEGGNQFAIYNNVTSTQPLTILSNGNIGIGTSSPTTLFHVAGTTNQASSMSSTSGTDAAIAANLSEIRQCSFNVDNSTNFVISNIVTSSTGWRAVFRGTWSNNYEGGALTPPPPYVEVNAANPSIIVGSRTLTVSRNGSGYLMVNSADSYRITFSGIVEIHQNPQSGQSNRSMQLLGGITFPATQSASGDANTLDDYEEGTWTPELSSAGGTPSGTTYTNRNGAYTKVGRVVTVIGGFQLSAKGTGGSGEVYVAGLPFTNSATGAFGEGAASVTTGYLTTASYNNRVTLFPQSAGAFLRARLNENDAALDLSEITNNTYIKFTATYFV